MNRSTRLPAGLGAIIAAAIAADLAGEDVKIPGLTTIKLDGQGSLDEQLARATEEGARRHRETCTTCRELYEEHAQDKLAKQGDDAKAPSRGITDEVKEALKSRHDEERMAMAKRHEQERTELEAMLAKQHGGEEHGFMLLRNGEPLPESFNTDRGVLEEMLTKLNGPDVTGILKMLGIDDDGEYEIREVTTRTYQL